VRGPRKTVGSAGALTAPLVKALRQLTDLRPLTIHLLLLCLQVSEGKASAFEKPMILLREAKQIKIQDATQVTMVFRDLLALEDKIARDTEHYYVMHLDVRQTVKLVELVNIGVLSHTTVHPRETFREQL
jgi:DNA repair protein RadC